MSDTALRTAALVLAAGRGTRFGGGKMLADVSGRPMLQRVLDLAATAGLKPVVVILGDDADEVEATLSWRDEVRVRNPDPGRGIASSIALGLAALQDGPAERVVVLLGDQPRLTRAQLRSLLATPRDRSRPVVVPRYEGVPGNPVLLERAAWPLAGDLHGDRGMSQLFDSHAAEMRYVDLPGTNPDVDTPDDLAALSRAGAPTRSDRTGAVGRSRP